MKLGFGLYRHMLDPAHYAFARQCGATHLVVHLVDYFGQRGRKQKADQPVGKLDGWGVTEPKPLWDVEFLSQLKREINEHDLELAAVENFDPVHWHDVLLDGPKKHEQIQGLKTLIRSLGEAGIPTMGYNFSLAGVAGREQGPFARGGAKSVGMIGESEFVTTPFPRGMVWNMIYDIAAPEEDEPSITKETLWDRLAWFLAELVPVAEEVGVTLAAHPDDPPLDTVRGQPRLVNRPELYQKLLDLQPSLSNGLEFCIGTLAEMPSDNLYDWIDRYTATGRVAYIHLRNVRGKVPQYRETFIDEGDIDVPRVFSILRNNNYQGVIIPDHTPQMSCDAPWHAGMAYAMGYLKSHFNA